MKKINVGILGAGISGSYLHHKFSNSPRFGVVDIFDLPKAKLGCSCAFGTETREFSRYMGDLGLEPDDYILQHINWLDFQGGILKCRTNNFCTIDRNKLINDLVGKDVRRDEADFDDYDYVVDATGHARAFLPPVQKDFKIKTRQVRTTPIGAGHWSPWVAHISFKGIGYEWAFPLGNHMWHIGYGDRDTKRKVKAEGQIICACKDEIRLAPPSMCHPLVWSKIWGVGESIGAVSPIAGSGIISSLRCAEILYENWVNGPNSAKYRIAVLKEFSWMDAEYRTIMHFMEGRTWRGIIGFIRNFSNGKRFGIKMKSRNFLKILKVIRSWSKSMSGRC